MSKAQTIDAELTLLSTNEGGRRQPLYFGKNPAGRYSPHIVIGDPARRKPVVRDGKVGKEEYLGVTIVAGPDIFRPGDSWIVKMSLMYHPIVDYSAVIPGATFTLREGGSIIGFGRVTKRDSTA